MALDRCTSASLQTLAAEVHHLTEGQFLLESSRFWTNNISYEPSRNSIIIIIPFYKAENTAVGIRHADHVAPSTRKKLALTSLTSGGPLVARSV
jgi:hypothetical protein